MNLMSKSIFKERRNIKNFRGCLTIILFVFLMFALVSCGKKGPPVPPEMLPIPAVTDLEAKVVNDSLELTWTVQTGKNVTAPDGFRIYRSRKSVVDSEACAGCPDVFEKVSELVTNFSLWGTAGNRFNYRDTLEKGYVFRYKVIAFTDRGLTSEWSNTVEVVPGTKSTNSDNSTE